MLKTLKLFARHHFTDRPYDGPLPDPHFAINSLGFDLELHYTNVRKKGGYKLAEIPYNNSTYPIYCLDYPSTNPAAKKLFILVGTHGNEQGGLMAAEQIMSVFDSKTPLPISVRIITPHNPVGAANFSRYNGTGHDINRDFMRQRSTETRAVIQAFESFQPDFAISFHEGPHAGVFLYTNKYCFDSVALGILDAYKNAGITLATKSYLRNTLKHAGWFPVRGFFGGLLAVWTKAFGYEGFGQYCTKKQVANIVIETSWASTESEQRIMPHVIATRWLIKSL